MNNRSIKNAAIYVVTSVISLLVILYIGYHMMRTFSTGVETQAAVFVIREETVSAEGYIMRSETMLYPRIDGSISYTVADGKRVSVGQTVAEICYGDGTKERIAEIDAELELLRESSLGEDIALSDTAGIDGQIAEIYASVCQHLAAGDVEYASYRRDELLALLNKRRIVLGSSGGYGDRIAALENERAHLAGSSGEVKGTVTADVSGYFYSYSDGYEKIFDASKVGLMTLDDFHNMQTSLPNEHYTAAGGCVGKVVTDYIWYLAFEIPVETYRTLGEAANYDVIFPYNADIRLTMEVERIVVTADRETVLIILSSGEVVENFEFLRKQKIELVKTSYSGYSVPSESLRMVDDVYGVYILDGSVVRFREVSILAHLGDGYVVEEYDATDESQANRLRLYEFIITKGKDLYDGKIIS